MAKRIRVDEQVLAQARADFEEKIKNLRATDGVLEFKQDIGVVDEKATVFFESDAYLKMRHLVDCFDSEIGWHGITHKLENHIYLVTDILVYPQIVTGATITQDEKENFEWMFSLGDKVNNMRMQGHSHVNMGVSPSGTDLELYQKFLRQLPEDDYYIFLITNKKRDVFFKIYDLKDNILFETKDVSYDVIFNDGKETLANYLEDADGLVKKKTYSYSAPSKSVAVTDKKTTKIVGADDKTKSYKSYYDYPWYEKYDL